MPGRVFDNLARLAENHRCCILLIRHLRKRGRGLVPVELSAAVRTEFLAGSSPDAPSQPALVQVKSNLGCLAPSLGYFIDNTGSFSWTGPSNLAPEELMTDRPIGAGLPLRKLAAGWLRDYLATGSAPNTTSRQRPSATVSASGPCAAPNLIWAS